MIARLLACVAAACIAAVTAAAPAHAQKRDAFAVACMASGKKSQRACDCEARLARRHLNQREQRAALAALAGRKDVMAREVRAMGQKGAQAFANKMGRLGVQARKQCRS